MSLNFFLSQKAIELLLYKFLPSCAQFRNAPETSRSSNCPMPNCPTVQLYYQMSFVGNLIFESFTPDLKTCVRDSPKKLPFLLKKKDFTHNFLLSTSTKLSITC